MLTVVVKSNMCDKKMHEAVFVVYREGRNLVGGIRAVWDKHRGTVGSRVLITDSLVLDWDRGTVIHDNNKCKEIFLFSQNGKKMFLKINCF